MSMIQKTLLPQINIRKMFVNQENVVINGFMTAETPGSGGSPFWMDEKYFSQYISVYFVVNHIGDNLGQYLGDPSTRVASYAEYSNADFQEWDYDIRNRFDHKIISLTDITLAEADIVVSDSDIMSANPDDSGGMLRDIAFSIEVPLSPSRLFGPGNPPVVSDVTLCAFTHLDFNGMVQDFNLSVNEQSYLDLMKVGGNFVVENMLVVGNDASGNSVYRVPQSTTMLVYSDDNGNAVPYHGAYHYHGPDNPGPGGYIGYMEGTPASMHPDSRRLTEVEIPYAKVVANFLLDDTLFVSNYDGSSDRIAADFAQEPTGTRQDPGYVYNADYIRQKALENFYKTDRRGPDQRNQPIVYNAEHWLEPNRLGQVRSLLTFTVDFEELIKTRSRYPLFYERFGTWFNLSEEELQNRSRVRSFKITRFRLSNSARSNNDVCTADYNNYSNEEIEETVFFASQPDNSKFIFPGAPAANHWPPNPTGFRNTIIREVSDNDNSSDAWYQRTYKLKDREMSSFNFGKYAYNLYMHIEDAVKIEFIKVIESFRENVQGVLVEFISLATMGRREYDDGTVFNETELVPPGQLRYVEGYDHDQKKYTDHFKELSRAQFDRDLRDLVDTFVNLQGLIGTFQLPGSSAEEELAAAASVAETLKKNLIPAGSDGESGDLDAAFRFSEYCNNLISTFDEILKKDSIFDSEIQSQTSSTVLGQKRSSDKTSKIIEYKARIPGFTEAYNVGDVFVQYDLSDLNTLAGEIAAAPSMFSFILDRENTAPILDVRAWTNASQIISDNLEASLENIIRTPPELTLNQARDIEHNIPSDYLNFGSPGLAIDVGGESFLTNAADINLNMGDFSSTDITTPLGSIGQRSVVSATGEFSLTKQNDKIEAIRQKNKLNTYKSPTAAALGSRLARAASKKSKGTSTGLIKSKSKKLLVRTGKSAAATYVPASVSMLQAMGSTSNNVYLKVDDHVGKEEGSYRVSAPPVKMTISNAINMLNENTPEPDPPVQQARTPSVGRVRTSSGPRLSTTRGTY